ncbi:MAG: FAD-binding oxidoreductase [Eubacteriales bacterium]
MGKTLRETLLGSLQNGEQVLNEIAVLKKISNDKIYVGNRPDAIIGQLHAKELSLEVVKITDETEGAKCIRLASTTGYLPPFEAGQYVNIFTVIDGVRTSRPYSISSSPRQRGYYEITVARIKTGFVSDFFLDNVKVGDVFEANGPSGVFHYNPISHKKTSVFLAGGSGITPFLSMSREVLEAGLDREIHLLYGCRSVDVAIYHDVLTKFNADYENFHYHLIISDADAAWDGERGFIDAAMMKKLVGDLDNCTFYICGPQIMNDFCVNELKGIDVPKKRIRREMFGSRQDIQNEPGWPANLTGEEVFNVTIGDKVIKAKASDSLLTSLEIAGIRVNVCCRSGECSLCRVKLASGNVFLAKGVLQRYADEQFGYIHTCKSYPIGDIELIL